MRAVSGRSFVHNYTPKSHPVNSFKAALKLFARQAYSGPLIGSPIVLTIIFVLPRTKLLIWKTKPMPRVPHTARMRNDVDNLIKAVLDALTHILWSDDAQVYKVTSEKWIAAGDEPAHTEVTIAYDEAT